MSENTSLPKVLIVGTLPYDPNESSRALDTYFHNWPKEKLRMIFSNSNLPKPGHCSSFFQITDADLIKYRFRKKSTAGRVISNDNLALDEDSAKTKKNNKSHHFINVFKKKNVLRFYLRKALWKRKHWFSDKLKEWVEEFGPEIIYICFSDDYFILDISYELSKMLGIPIVVQIGDDYYFKKNNLLMRHYIKQYKTLFDKIMNTPGFGVYISNKLSTKYNSYFRKQGFPVYLSSDIISKHNNLKYEYNYFGKTDLGRYKSLAMLGDALKRVDNQFFINVYSSFSNKKIVRFLSKHNCSCFKPIPYDDVKSKMDSGAFNVVASGFGKKDIEATRYSLSTKIADSLVSSGPIIAIGPKDDGAIDYLKENECAIVLSGSTDMNSLKEKLANIDYLNEISKKASCVYNKNHDLQLNRSKFEEECRKLVYNQ